MTTALRGADADLRADIAQAVAGVLRIPVSLVGDEALFSSLGLDSLAAAELTADLEDALGIEVPLAAVHEYPTVSSLARFLAGGGPESAFDRMRADAVLPEDIRPVGTAVRTRDARTLLLTGATGFLGAHVLRRLLDETTAVIVCLVRAESGRGLARVRANLGRYGLDVCWEEGRVVAVGGDLARPALGLAPSAYDALARRADAVIHVGASVDWVQSYESLRAVNVLGTREVVRLACTGTPKPLHFVSSLSACYSTLGPRVIDEGQDALAHLEGVHFGYAQSKCVSEALVLEAGRRGLPVSVIRPALVSGDSVQGRSNVDDLLTRILAGCIRMGAAPDLDWRVDSLPVDQVATAIVRAALSQEAERSVLHISAQSPRHWRECVLWMHMCGYPMSLVPYGEWCERVGREATHGHPLHPLRAFFARAVSEGLSIPETYEESRRARIRDATSRERLATLDARCTTIDSALLGRYFDRYVEEGIVPDALVRQAAMQSPKKPDLLPLLEQLRASVGDAGLTLDGVELTRLGADASIISELTSLREGSDVGLYRGMLNDRRVIVKVKPVDESAIAMLIGVAQLNGPELGALFERFTHRLALKDSHVREIEMYRSEDPRFRRNMPEVLALSARDGSGRWVAVLEELPESELSPVSDAAPGWADARLDTVLRGMAEFQAVWMGREAELRALPWLAPERTPATVMEFVPMYRALAEQAIAKSGAWKVPGLAEVHLALVEATSQWAGVFERLPRTLIHNDFNPRNIAVRGGAEPRLCVFDWEAAAIGVPQRDLAELLTWTLDADASRDEVARWLERARVLVGAASGVELSRADWDLGFRASLAELFVDRLAMYAMVDHIRPQPYLPRVIRTWAALQRHYPWVDPA